MPSKAPSKPRLRASCDGCFLAKVKCSKLRPVCSRCLTVGLHCRYSPSSRAGKGSANSSIPQRQAGRGRRYLADGGEDLASTLWSESCVELGAYLQSRMYRGPGPGEGIHSSTLHGPGPSIIKGAPFIGEPSGRNAGNNTTNNTWSEGTNGAGSHWQGDFAIASSPNVLLSSAWSESPTPDKHHYAFPSFSHTSSPPDGDGLGLWTQAEILEQELWSHNGAWYTISPEAGEATEPGSYSSR